MSAVASELPTRENPGENRACTYTARMVPHRDEVMHQALNSACEEVADHCPISFAWVSSRSDPYRRNGLCAGNIALEGLSTDGRKKGSFFPHTLGSVAVIRSSLKRR